MLWRAAAGETWLWIELPTATAFASVAGHIVALAGLSSPRARRPLSSRDVYLPHRDQSLEVRGSAPQPTRRVLARARATEPRDPRGAGLMSPASRGPFRHKSWCLGTMGSTFPALGGDVRKAHALCRGFGVAGAGRGEGSLPFRSPAPATNRPRRLDRPPPRDRRIVQAIDRQGRHCETKVRASCSACVRLRAGGMAQVLPHRRAAYRFPRRALKIVRSCAFCCSPPTPAAAVRRLASIVRRWRTFRVADGG